MMSITRFDPDVLVAAGFPALGRRFLLWRTFPPRHEGGKPVKLPCSTMGRPVDGTDERRWLDFHVGVRLASRSGFGLGVALGWGLGGLDLDRFVEPAWGRPTDEALVILRHFPTFTEYSPSGRGLHAYFFASATFTVSAKRDDRGIELYAGRRFFALTGRVPGGAAVPVADCTGNARALAGALRPTTPQLAPHSTASPSSDALARLRDCGVVRERPSYLRGAIYSLRRCPFTNDEHRGGGPYAIVFADGAVLFRCDRSVHGPLREMVQPPRKPR
jgi:hypothetical protein